MYILCVCACVRAPLSKKHLLCGFEAFAEVTICSYSFWVVIHRLFRWFVTNVSAPYILPIFRVRTLMMGRTLDPETLVRNQAKTTLSNNPNL
jgi:hypothetical protein